MGVLSEMDVQVWIDYAKQNWVLILVALAALFLIANLVKTVIKWVFIVAIAAFLIIYSGISIKDLGSAVTTVKNETLSTMQSEAMDMMTNEAKDAKFEQHSDGSFVITTPNLKVTGEAGSDKVKVSLRGIPLGEWSRSDALDRFIEEAKRSGGQ